METKKDLEGLDLVKKAEKFYDAIMISGDLHEKVEITPDRIKLVRVGVALQNSLINAFRAKAVFFRLLDADAKIKVVKDRQEE